MVETKCGIVKTTKGSRCWYEILDPLDWNLFVDLFAGFVCLREIICSNTTSCAHVKQIYKIMRMMNNV